MFFKNSFYKKLSIVIVVIFLLSTISVSANVDNKMSISDLMPKYQNYKWSYWGTAEYGHEMNISSIVKDEGNLYYSISGKVEDMSGGESNTDYNISLAYIVKPNVLIQVKDEEAMLDSKFDRIELIRGPLELGSNWTQEVVDNNGNINTLNCYIQSIQYEDNKKVYTVLYNDVDSRYYEKRKIKEDVGVISFSKLIISDSEDTENYEVSYDLYSDNSGLKHEYSFDDTYNNSWYMDYVPKLIDKNIIDGYANGTFKPDEYITVAEFLKMIVQSKGYYNEDDPVIWYSPYVESAIDLNIISNDEFDAYDRAITREEMAKILINAINETPYADETPYLKFNDYLEIGSDYYSYVNKAVDLGILDGYPADNTFRPKESVTRAEAAKILYYTEQFHDYKEFTVSEALEMEKQFKDMLFQDTYDETLMVKDFDSKQNLIVYLSSIMNKDLAKNYVDTYYNEEFGALYLIPMDGPAMINEDKPHTLKIINPEKFKMTQKTSTGLLGPYKLSITYEYFRDKWIMTERDVKLYNDENKKYTSVKYEVLDKTNLSEKLQNKIDVIKIFRGYSVLKNTENESIVYVGIGEKSVSGYDVKVTAVENTENSTHIYVEEISPPDDQVVAQVVTYPHVITKIYNMKDDLNIITIDR